MAYVFVKDVAASWEQYSVFARAFEGLPPKGLLLHAAGPTDEGFRIVGVWQSEEAWDRFCADRLETELAAFSHAPPAFRSLVTRHVVHGRGWMEGDVSADARERRGT